MWTNRVFVCSALSATSFHFTPQLSQKAMLEKFLFENWKWVACLDNLDFVDFFYFDPYHHNHQQKQHDRVQGIQ